MKKEKKKLKQAKAKQIDIEEVKMIIDKHNKKVHVREVRESNKDLVS